MNKVNEKADRQKDYQDSSEEELLELFSSPGTDEKINSLLQTDLSWPLRYHLSPQRQNLLNWYPFPKESSLLEVGAGCGALTGLFCERLKSVTALELTEKRSKVIKQRFVHKENLTVLSGNIENLSVRKKFDYVVCVGVLEYAGVYISGEAPQLKFLKNLGNYLRPTGKLILAIENRLGLKYWSGCREDHTGVGFDSITGYLGDSKIKTYGKLELNNLLKQAKYKVLDWYYPLPDYKLPIEIFSDHFLPVRDKAFSSGVFPTKDLSMSREYFFPEDVVGGSLAKNGLFGDFANSFLVFAQKDTDD